MKICRVISSFPRVSILVVQHVFQSMLKVMCIGGTTAPNKEMERAVNSVNPFAGRRRAPLFPAAIPEVGRMAPSALLRSHSCVTSLAGGMLEVSLRAGGWPGLRHLVQAERQAVMQSVSATEHECWWTRRRESGSSAITLRFMVPGYRSPS